MTYWKDRLSRVKPALILFYLSATGFLTMLSVQRYLGLRFEVMPALCFTSIIFGIYTFNRFTDSAEDFANDEGKFLYFKSKPAYLVLSMASLAAGTLTLLAQEKLTWLHGLLLCMCFCYSCRIIPWFGQSGVRLIRLKDVPLVKNLLVSFLWSASILALPAFFASRSLPFSHNFGVLAGGVFLMILNNTLVHDAMDEYGDRLAGISTVPTLVGARATMVLLWCIDGAWLSFLAILCATGRIHPAAAAVPVIIVCFSWGYGALYASGKATRFIVDFLSESDLIVLSVGLLTLGHLG